MALLPFLISLKLSIITTFILLILGLPVSYFLALSKFKFKFIIKSIMTLPLVLPPTVLGFYFLIFFSKKSFIGFFFEKFFNIRLTFTFTGLIIASCIYSMPFMFQYLINGIENFNESLLDASYTLGKSKIYTFFKIIIPNIKPNLISGIIMTFVHTLGEFGVVLMIGGNIPGKTKVISIAIYDKVEELNYSTAHKYSFFLVLFSFIVILIINCLNFNHKKFGYKND